MTIEIAALGQLVDLIELPIVVLDDDHRILFLQGLAKKAWSRVVTLWQYFFGH